MNILVRKHGRHLFDKISEKRIRVVIWRVDGAKFSSGFRAFIARRQYRSSLAPRKRVAWCVKLRYLLVFVFQPYFIFIDTQNLKNLFNWQLWCLFAWQTRLSLSHGCLYKRGCTDQRRPCDSILEKYNFDKETKGRLQYANEKHSFCWPPSLPKIHVNLKLTLKQVFTYVIIITRLILIISGSI